MKEPILFLNLPPGWTVHYDGRNSSKTTEFYDLKEDGDQTPYYFLHSLYLNKWRLSGGEYIGEKTRWPNADTPTDAVNQLRAHLLAQRMGVTE